MHRLSLITSLFVILLIVGLFGFYPSGSPHGDSLKNNCSDCHSTNGWKMDSSSVFQHSSTNFQLEGQHATLNCLSCHPTLVFNDAKSTCNECHADVHEQTVGVDCARCHNTNSFLVSNILEIHQLGRFPLVGAHSVADCYDCHKTSSLLQFPTMSIQCIDCHNEEYASTTNPNHLTAGFSTDCETCHVISAYEWNSGGFHHNFFPLEQGHANIACDQCHTPGDFGSVSKTCYGCHSADYNSTTNPNHLASGFTTDCTVCHTLSPGWRPAEFDHDPWFPIYSGKHKGEWNNCTDCHNNSSNYNQFTCIDCHEHSQSSMNNEHDEVNNYSYNSNACFDCHPRGDKRD